MSIAMVELYRILGRFEKGPHDDPNCRLTAEGAALDAYLCSADKPTLAFGCTYHPDGTPVRMGDSITPAQVYPYTEAAVARVVADVKRIVKRPLDDYQMAALCSFVFNLGGKNLADSTQLLPAIEAGRWEDAAEYMSEFIRAWGKLEGKWHRKAERGLLIRRYAEGCLLLGLDWQPWCNTDNIKLVEELHWQPDWVDPKGIRTGGRYFDEVLPATTEFTAIESMARATPLPAPELVLTTKAAPAAVPATVTAGQPAPPPSQAQAAPAPKPIPPAATSSPAAGPAPSPKPPQGTSVAPVPASKPAALPTQVGSKPPEAPVPIGQQTGAVDAARKSEEWSASAKAMWQSRRFWGLVLVLGGRVWMLKTGSTAVLGTVSDPLIVEMFSGFMVMIVGELVQVWGERKATRPLR